MFWSIFEKNNVLVAVPESAFQNTSSALAIPERESRESQERGSQESPKKRALRVASSRVEEVEFGGLKPIRSIQRSKACKVLPRLKVSMTSYKRQLPRKKRTTEQQKMACSTQTN